MSLWESNPLDLTYQVNSFTISELQLRVLNWLQSLFSVVAANFLQPDLTSKISFRVWQSVLDWRYTD